MERPMALLGISFFMSLLMASFLELKMTVVLAALFFAAFLIGLFVKQIRKNRQVMMAIFAAVAAFSMYSVKEMLSYRPLQRWDGQNAALRVETVDMVQDNNRVTVRVIGGELPKGTRINLWLSGTELYPKPYDILEGEFSLSTPNKNIRSYFKANGIYLNGYAAGYGENEIKHIKPDVRPFMYHIIEARRSARNTIMSQKNMDGTSGLIAGIAFGFKQDISPDIEYNFRTVGVSHLLAVSGLHVALLSQALLWFLCLLRIPRRLSLGISSAGVLFFVALTGFEPSILRAGLMCLIFLVGQMIGRESDGLNSLGVSVFGLTVFNPYAVNDVGLLLSFSATYGLLVLYPMLKRTASALLEKRSGKMGAAAVLCEKAVDSVMITAAATLPTLPVILFSFGQISLISPIANLLMVFPTSVVTVAACAAVPLYHIAPLRFISSFLFGVAKVVTGYLIKVSEWLASIPFATVWAKQSFMIILIPAAICLVILGYRLLGRHGLRIMAVWSVIAMLCGVLTHRLLMKDVTDITVLNAGYASALLLERDGRTGVIMMGDGSAASSAAQELERRNVRTVDFLMIPNLDDECAFCPMALTDRIGVNCLITGASGEYSDTVDALKSDGRIRWDNCCVKFWSDCYAELYNGWLGIKIGKTRILVSPDKSKASDLNEGQRKTNLVVYTGGPPQHVSSITAQAGVLCCRAETLSAKLKGFTRDSYPLYNTTERDITIRTRGTGDLYFLKKIV